jgi:hypothetical protein
MSRCLGMAVAGALLLAVCGCSLDAFLAPSAVPYGPKTVAAGSLSRVCAKLQDGLSDSGIMVQMNRVGSDLRLAGISKTQTVFCLHMSGQKDATGNKTLIRMQWDRGGDDELWQLILKILASPTPVPDDTSKTPLVIPSAREEK